MVILLNYCLNPTESKMKFIKPIISGICLTMFVFFFTSCSKEEGKGGEYSIKGKVLVNYYQDNFSTKSGSGVAKDYEVYILYGDQVGLGDKVRTDYKGEFEFKYLQKGNYKIYVYSDDTTMLSPSGRTILVQEVSISGNKTLDDFIVSDNDDRKDGEGVYSISGKVFTQNCNKYFTTCNTGVLQPDVEVFIRRINQNYYFDKESTSDLGFYQFTKLAPGEYVVYTSSKNPLYASDKTLQETIAISDTITISSVSFTNIDFTIKNDDKDFYKGIFSIKGSVVVENCNSTFSDCRPALAQPDIDVFIRRIDESYYFDKVSTSDAGTFEFLDLPNGEYIVYSVSKNKNYIFDPFAPKTFAVSDTVKINNANGTATQLTITD